MPGLWRRRDMDGRGDRLESEVRVSEFRNKDLWKDRSKLPFCSKCNRAFEEQSRFCPRCDSKSMGYLAQIPEKHREEAHRNALRRLRQKYA